MFEIEPPAPGRMPTNRPIREERTRLTQRANTSRMAFRCSTFTACVLSGIKGVRARSESATSLSNWLNAKSPISTGRKENPWRSASMPKSNLATPLMSSSPMVAASRPRAPAISPFSMLSPARLAVMVSANITRAK